MKREIRWPSSLILSLLFVGAASSSAAEPNRKEGNDADALRVYIGTYTQGGSKGIYLGRLDVQSGKLSIEGLAAEAVNPSFLAIHPDGKHVYAVGEIANFEEEKTGAVTAFAIDAESGKLREINRQPSAGAGPCHLVVDPTGQNVLVANYGAGSVACLPLRKDGGLQPASSAIQHEGSSVNPRRQKGPHAHSINVGPQNGFAYAADLGLDAILIYRFDARKGLLSPADPPQAKVAPGAGPRHFAFHPNGRTAYVINEMNSTVTAFAYDPEDGSLKELQTIGTLPEDFGGRNSTAEVRVHPSGKFLYGSNRGHDSIAIFSIDAKSGELTAVGHESTRGKTPRNFNLDPSGRILLAANQSSDSIAAFRVDSKTGKLAPLGDPVAVPRPVCIRFLAVR